MPGSDDATTFRAYALLKVGGEVEEWSYTPRALGDDDVEISITHCGICGSDLHTISGGWGVPKVPIVAGHEIVGHIKAVGKNVTNFKIGDRVGCGAQCGCCLDFPEVYPNGCRGCNTKQENHCQTTFWTYNSTYPDGERTQGGYATGKRFNQRFCFHIPEKISSAEAAPLLCAGATVWGPIARYGAKGKKVAVIGLGGLGHLAVQFAAKMGGHVTVFGTSDKKKDLAIKLGAEDYINVNDEAGMKKAKGTFGLVVCCGNGKGQDWDALVALGDFDSNWVTVALPEEPLKLRAGGLCASRVNVTGSAIGSPEEIRAMLDFCAANDVRPMIEILPMSQVNKGLEKVKNNDVVFRVVLEAGK